MIRKANKEDFPQIIELCKKLTGWFDNDAITRAIPADLQFHHVLVAEENNLIVGFLTYSSHEGNPYIGWLGVEPGLHGQGTGTKLIQYLENELGSLGMTQLQVETLADTIDYEPYVKTRQFYKKMGFKEGEIRPVISGETKEKLDLVTFHKDL